MLDLEVIYCGKEIFQGKAFYHYLVCSLYFDTVSAPSTLCEGPPLKGYLLFGLLTSVIAPIDYFLALIVSAKLSVNSFQKTMPCHAFEGKMPSPSILQQPVWWISLLHPGVHFYAIHML